MGLGVKRVSWILDADISKFFDTIEHDWLVRFIEHRIADARIVRLIKKWLTAGVLEQGKPHGLEFLGFTHCFGNTRARA